MYKTGNYNANTSPLRTYNTWNNLTYTLHIPLRHRILRANTQLKSIIRCLFMLIKSKCEYTVNFAAGIDWHSLADLSHRPTNGDPVSESSLSRSSMALAFLARTTRSRSSGLRRGTRSKFTATKLGRSFSISFSAAKFTISKMSSEIFCILIIAHPLFQPRKFF